jgi:tetraacyldisaccharide 4'-kinase
MDNWTLWIEGVIREERGGLFAFLYRLVAYPLSQGFRLILWCRHRLYALGWLEQYSAPIPVISIGNLSVGGTGKTALTSFFVDACSPFCKVAVLSRGYGRIKKRQTPFFVDFQKTTPEECGDEPWLLAKRHPEALVIISPNRVAGAHFAHQLGAQLILLDDGMQHLRLKRDMEVVIVHPSDRHFLPLGTLRERPKRLEEADLIFSEESFPVKRGQLPIRFSRKTKGVYQLPTLKPISLNEAKVALISAIARPERFLKSVEAQQAEVLSTLFLPDHSFFQEQRVEVFCKKALQEGARYIVTTEKDRMKFSEKFLNAYPVVFLKQEVELLSREESFQKALQTIQEWVAA